MLLGAYFIWKLLNLSAMNHLTIKFTASKYKILVIVVEMETVLNA